MRQVQDSQLKLGQVDIPNIKLSTRSRDDIPDILRGLQYIYSETHLREALFDNLESLLSDAQKATGRQGMDLWNVFVLATLRVNLGWDYDRLLEVANEHRTIRLFLGHGAADEYCYALQTIKDNVQLLTDDVLKTINNAVVEAGHGLVKKKDQKDLQGRCDSFAVETNVHFPTDISLLWDALRKCIGLVADACSSVDMTDWRQYKHNTQCIKKAFRKAQQSKRGNGTNKEDRVHKAHQAYLDIANGYLTKLKDTCQKLQNYKKAAKQLTEIQCFIADAERQVDQIERRVLKGETIPQSEKVFSLFEKHTEWINKGKANGRIELGIKVCVLEDQNQFILHHHIMYQQSDSDIAIDMVKQAQEQFPSLSSCSFDKGFYSKDNEAELETLLDTVTMPKKGRLSQQRQETERSQDFIKRRHQHSAVESAINCLEQHGLDRCPDHGQVSFERYVALAIVGRNVKRLGEILRQQEAAKERRRIKKARKKLAA